MNNWTITLQNIKSKPLYTFISIFTLSLSIILLIGTLQLKLSFENQINNNLGKIDVVIGAKGSPLQLVMASILHLDNPTGNIPYNLADKISKNPIVKNAVPISYGDNYKGIRIIGTTNDFLSLYGANLKKGRHIENSLEVIIGANVAQKLKLNIGDTFLSSHGLIENNIELHEEKFTVVGILTQTHKVIDRLIITNLESIWDVHNHDEEPKEHHLHEKHEPSEHEHNHDDHDDKEITSLLISFKSPRALLTFPRKINKQTNLLAALPKYELNKLYNYTGIGLKTITWIAYLILLISGITIFINLYKMTKERAFDLALFRSFGASNFQLIKIVTYEGFIILIAAFLIAFIFLKTLFYFIPILFKSNFHQLLIKELPFQETLYINFLVIGLTITSILLAIFPILKMNISTILSNEK